MFIIIPVCVLVIALIAGALIYFLGGNRSDGDPAPTTESDTLNEPTNDDPIDQQDEEEEEEIPQDDPMPVSLTVDEAWSIAQAWMDEHQIWDRNLLARDTEVETVNGEKYYRFFHVDPTNYWFSILVNQETGDLYCMLIEDGMDPGPPVIRPLDEWYDDWANMDFGDYSPSEDLYNAALHSGAWVEIYIYWNDDGRTTRFVRDAYSDWIMYSREGNVTDVLPTFSHRNGVLEIRFPTTQRVYYLHDDHTGEFGSEILTWSYSATW